MEIEANTERKKQLAKERKRRYLRRLKIEKYGAEFADTNMSGRHCNHAKGKNNGRWNDGRWVHTAGYIAVAVPVGHHLRMKNGYAYVHQIEAEKLLGRKLRGDESVHHLNGIVSDNRPENIAVLKRSDHSRLHARELRKKPGQFFQKGKFRDAQKAMKNFPVPGPNVTGKKP